MNTSPLSTTPLMRDDDLHVHIEDERCYGAIRHGTLIRNLTWNELTDSEQQAARSNLFYNPYYYEREN